MQARLPLLAHGVTCGLLEEALAGPLVGLLVAQPGVVLELVPDVQLRLVADLPFGSGQH